MAGKKRDILNLNNRYWNRGNMWSRNCHKREKVMHVLTSCVCVCVHWSCRETTYKKENLFGSAEFRGHAGMERKHPQQDYPLCKSTQSCNFDAAWKQHLVRAGRSSTPWDRRPRSYSEYYSQTAFHWITISRVTLSYLDQNQIIAVRALSAAIELFVLAEKPD